MLTRSGHFVVVEPNTTSNKRTRRVRLSFDLKLLLMFQLMTANGRPVVDFDHVARNGVVHVISEVTSYSLRILRT